MIGNDIVDLNHIQRSTNWKRKRFLSKIFSEKEQSYIANAEDQDQMVWRLWSMKEATYKAYVREFDYRFFNPKILECMLYSSTSGSVIIGNRNFKTTSNINEQFVYSEARTSETQILNSSIHEIPIEGNDNNQSSCGYTKLIQHIAKIKNFNSERINVVKSKIGVPYLFNGETKLPLQFSLTHCGRFVAFSILDN